MANFSQFNDQVELAAPGVGVLSTVPWVSDVSVTVDGVDYPAAHIEYAPFGSTSDVLVDGGLCTGAGEWTGNIVLCQRGEISFYDKVINVQNSGGVAVVIYNNVPGGFLGTLGEGYTSDILAVSLSMEDGLYLVGEKLGSIAYMNDNPPTLGNGYEAWDGTSMATPHVSAVAALIWSWRPSLTNVEICMALQESAKDLGEPGRDVHYGYGLVQAYDAWKTLDGAKGK